MEYEHTLPRIHKNIDNIQRTGQRTYIIHRILTLRVVCMVGYKILMAGNFGNVHAYMFLFWRKKNNLIMFIFLTSNRCSEF